MKLIKALLMLCLIGLLAAPALAEELPQDVQDFFASEKRSEYTVMAHQEIEGYYFVAARSGERTNTLFGFKETDKGWEYWLKNDDAMPQGGHRILMGNAQGANRLVDDYVYKLPTLSIAIIQEEEDDFYAYSLTYELRSGVWTLEDMSSIEDQYHITLGNNQLTYYDEFEAFRAKGTVRATVQRNLRYISLSALPTDYYEAKAKLTAAPKLPASAELQAQNIKFTGSRQYDVYSAPTRASYRGADGKAVVSTNSWIQVFGVEDGWAMIQYSIDAEHYRIGYIVEEALPASADVGYLDFSPIPAWTDRLVMLTDDPFYSGEVMDTIASGSQVQWLATIGNWAYVEVNGRQLMRGFVPAYALYTDYDLLMKGGTIPDYGADK